MGQGAGDRGRRNDATWRGPRLAEALALDPTHLTPAERAFIAASQHATRGRIWRRRGMIAAMIGVAGLVWAAQRYHAAHRLADAVGVEMAAARIDLDAARAADRAARRLAGDAFAAFDGGELPGAEALWQRTLALRADAARSYRAASRGVEAALAQDPTRRDVRDLLGDILFERAVLAELDRDAVAGDELRGRLAAYDADGSRQVRLAAPGRITVRAGDGAAFAIDGAPAGTGSASQELAAGLHAVDVTAPGRAAVHEPVVVERGATVVLELDPPPVAAVPGGYVYIAPGWFGYGTAADEDTRRTFLSTCRCTGAGPTAT
jgi:hypothetical protein